MAQAAGITASPPTTYPIYRGFYVLPTDILLATCVRVDFFRAISADDIAWGAPVFLGYGTGASGFYAIDTQLDENTFYGYYCVYVFADGSKTPYSEITDVGQAMLTPSSSLNIDKLASSAYTTGLITSGTFRGVIFETNKLDPKVRMDPTGIFATDGASNTIFYLHSDGTPAFFQGQLSALGVTLPTGVNEVFPTSGAPGNNTIQWVDAGNNDITGYVFGATFSFGGFYSETRVGAVAEGSSDGALTLLEAMDDLRNPQASLTATQIGRGTGASTGASAGSHSMTLIDQAGNSSFVIKGGGVVGTKLSWGSITTGSSSILDAGSADWSVAGTATGVTQISLGSTFAMTVACYGGARNTGGAFNWVVQGTNGVNPVFSSWIAGAFTNGLTVNFICIHD